MIAIWAGLMASAVLTLGEPGDGNAAVPKGKLVIDGGGRSAPALRKRILDVAGGPKSRILLITQASLSPTAATRTAQRWREVGAEDITVLDLADPAAATEAVRQADLIWMGGGDQER